MADITIDTQSEQFRKHKFLVSLIALEVRAINQKLKLALDVTNK